MGKCGKCGEFGTVEEVRQQTTAGLKTKSGNTRPAVRPARTVDEIGDGQPARRRPTGLGEFDRVIGGGLVDGQVLLLSGEPGVGKSTLILHVADRYLHNYPGPVVVISGEESSEQIALRARRLSITNPALFIADENDIHAALAHIAAHQPGLVIVDSVQVMASTDVEGRPGGPAQVMEVAHLLTRDAKQRGHALILIGQFTKADDIAGPRMLSHLVDTLLTITGDSRSSLRLLRSLKNRYGPAEELAAFEHTSEGLAEVPDPSELFRAHRDEPVPGTCVTAAVDGKRAILAEVQALVAATNAPNPRRGVSGLDTPRVTMLSAVVDRAARLRLGEKDVFTATVGGAKVADPAADLAVCLAIASAGWDTALPDDLAAVGEVALSGDVRPVGMMPARLAELQRLGYRRVFTPRGTRDRYPPPAGLTVIEVDHLTKALTALRGFAAPTTS